MHGLGNDFVMIDATQQQLQLSVPVIQQIAHRKFGVGCDQLLLLESCDDISADFVYRIFNADGSEAEQCGNGARCMMRFIKRHNLHATNKVRLKTLNRIIECQLLPDEQVSVAMGVPQKVDGPIESPLQCPIAEYYFVDVGNPHIVLFIEQAEVVDWIHWGKLLSSHNRFQDIGGVNVSFVTIKARGMVELNVYERGSGPTLACGSAACAAVVAGINKGVLGGAVIVSQKGGKLLVRCSKIDAHIEMIGPAQYVFSGEYQV